MQPLAGGDTRGMILQQSGSNQQPVNSESFYKQAEQNVAADEIFFYKYFSEKMSRNPSRPAKKPKKVIDGGEEEEGGLDEEDVWQALVQSRPEVEAPSDDSDANDEELDELAAALSDSDDTELEDDDEDEDALAELEESDGVEGEVEAPEFNDSDFEKEQDEFAEDDDDLLPSDIDASSQQQEEEEEEEEEFNGFDQPVKSKKRNAGVVDPEEEKKKQKKKKRVKLPTLASADDYLHLIEG